MNSLGNSAYNHYQTAKDELIKNYGELEIAKALEK